MFIVDLAGNYNAKQVSGVRCQVSAAAEGLEQAGQHPFEFYHGLVQGGVGFRTQIAHIAGEEQQVFALAGQAEGNLQKTDELGIALVATAFGDVGLVGMESAARCN